MKVSGKLRPLTAVLCGGALFAALSAHAVDNPPIHMTHGVEYMSGGIGSDEAQFMETVSPRWPATLEFAVKDHTRADFAADVRVTVRDQSGRAVLDNVLATGPGGAERIDFQIRRIDIRQFGFRQFWHHRNRTG